MREMSYKTLEELIDVIILSLQAIYPLKVKFIWVCYIKTYKKIYE
jgi:hypothetical protein